MGPVDFKFAAQQRFGIVDQADLCRRATHIEGQHAVFTQALRDMGRQDRPTSWPGFDQSDWKAGGGLDCHEATGRGHQEAGTSEPEGIEPCF